nr:FxsA family protein [Janibacter cremeus]
MAIVLVVILEIAVFVGVARLIGVLPTVIVVLTLSTLGAFLVRREGRRTWRALEQALRSGKMPNREIADAILVVAGGALLFIPGLVTSVVGLVFALPFTRPVARIGLEVVVARRLLAAGVGGEVRVRRTRPRGEDDVVEGEIIDDDE